MKLKKSIITSSFMVGVLGVGAVLPVVTVSAQGSDRAAQAQERRQAAEEVRSEQTRPSVEERKAEILERVEAKRAEVKEKLEQKRLEVCEKRADKINKIIAKSAENSERHLAVFQKIADRTQVFYEDKQLNVANYEELVATVEEKEADAVAAIEAIQEVTFDCAEQDPSNVGATVRDVMKTQHQALKEYRTSIKDLIVGIKQSAQEAEAEEGAEEATDETTETEAEQSTDNVEQQ